MEALIDKINNFAWGPGMLVLLAGTGIYLSVRLKALQIRLLPAGIRALIRGDTGEGSGDIGPAQALMTSLAATVGTGNIAGVATAIAAGGPGALFWMWMIALVGMATKYAEAVLAVHYRETDALGNHVGGPMYYIRNGLGQRWAWLAAVFAFFGMIAGFGIGNGVQANSVADAISAHLLTPESSAESIFATNAAIGFVMMLVVGMVILGGIQRIAQVASALVPFMATFYVLAGLLVIFINIEALPAVLTLVIESAFTGTAAAGGFAGATVMAAIQMGIARGIFSNEAGLGSAPIAHAAARTNNPVRQGTIAMLGTFIDTIIICSMTGLAILLTGVWTTGDTGARLSMLAFDASLPGWGDLIVSTGLVIFAFTTILGWSVYSERCAEYLFGVRAILPFRLLWVLAVFVGPVISLDLVWKISDTLNALMAVPNLIALLLLSPVVASLSKSYIEKRQGIR